MKIKTWKFALINAYDNTIVRTTTVKTSENATYKQAYNKAYFKFHGKKKWSIGTKIIRLEWYDYIQQEIKYCNQ